MSIAESIKSCLDEHHIDYELVQHPKTYTSRDTARAAHVSEDHIAKAVVVENLDGYAMAVIPASGWLRLRALRDDADRSFILADESEVEKMFAGIGQALLTDGRFCLYGPFNYDGQFTSDSNANFDVWLKNRDPKSGVRDVTDLGKLAEKAGLKLVEDYEMPANNRILVWQAYK